MKVGLNRTLTSVKYIDIKQLFRLLLVVCLTLSLINKSYAQEQQKDAPADSLVRLLSAQSAKLKQIDSNSFREIIGPAKFLHNGTYLLCDSALWNVSTNIIDAVGNVQIIQENTTLKSDRIEYIVDLDIAKFRGNLVELYDNEGNILRTNFLDYNTKDSSGVFYNGGVLVNEDGNLIESIRGNYESKEKLFTFTDEVEMFTDSTFIKSDKVDYRTDLNIAYLSTNTVAWQDENILSANSGEFQRNNNILIFNKDSYILTPEQELWADNLKYFRLSSNAELNNNVQMVDTVQSVIALSHKAIYNSNPMRIELSKEPALGLCSYEEGVRDTLFFRADLINYYTKRYCDIDSAIVAQCIERKELSELDPIAQIEKENAEMLQKMYERANYDPSKPPPTFEANDSTLVSNSQNQKSGEDRATGGKPQGGRPQGDRPQGDRPQGDKSQGEKPQGGKSQGVQSQEDRQIGPIKSLGDDHISIDESLTALQDSTLVEMQDTVVVVVPKDTTSVAFIDAYNNVKFYRADFQGKADSLVYVGIDSIARFYKDPILWNGVNNQFTSDSMQIVIEGGTFTKANLLSNAFIAAKEDTLYYNQIKSPEMIAYFADGDLTKFDALGGVSAIFYLSQQDSIISEMNQKESKMMQARFKNREIQRLKYIESIKNDLYPVFDLAVDKQKLRGFEWREDQRPTSRYDITKRGVKPTKRVEMEIKEYPQYSYTEIYFPQKRDTILIYKSYLDSLKLAQDAPSSIEIVEDTTTTLIVEDSLDTNIKESQVARKELLDAEIKLSELDKLNSKISENKGEQSTKSSSVNKIKEQLRDKTLNREEKRALKSERRVLKRELKDLKREEKRLKKESIKLQRKSK